MVPVLVTVLFSRKSSGDGSSQTTVIRKDVLRARRKLIALRLDRRE